MSSMAKTALEPYHRDEPQPAQTSLLLMPAIIGLDPLELLGALNDPIHRVVDAALYRAESVLQYAELPRAVALNDVGHRSCSFR